MEELKNVKIVKVDIPFFSLCNLLLKLYFAWMLATIVMLPILLILFFIISVIFSS